MASMSTWPHSLREAVRTPTKSILQLLAKSSVSCQSGEPWQSQNQTLRRTGICSGEPKETWSARRRESSRKAVCPDASDESQHTKNFGRARSAGVHPVRQDRVECNGEGDLDHVQSTSGGIAND